ncbi:hypothetical protein OR60_16195 [Xanthomonas vesicatoria]|uniref:Uncharacterized protein n=1 Tax=Xanthomonas vesicatoria TaxID=56460 RepID=A0AAJ0IYK7_9XANT|nr:hypothetical protein BI313_17395 [Xanthomonas vesicatoria]KHM92591.1 hypothetical protein OR60_16195 [Xanthomonas vesicatoria]KHM95094.1 hypothetical protein OR61_09695 [Xanthomonas vesicatoria]
MRRHGTETCSSEEHCELSDLLKSAPGVGCIKLVERHPRVGYRVTFARTTDQLDAFIATLEEHDWMSVM